MLSQIRPIATAISINDKVVTYEQLAALVEKQTKLLDNQLRIKSEMTLDFIVNVLAALQSKVPVIIYPKEYEKNIDTEIKNLHPDCSLVLLTSGSSGESKFVQLSIENIQANIDAITLSLDFDSVESQVLFLPLSYSFGLIGQLLKALSLGKTTYLADHFIKIKKIVQDNKVNMISAVPSHFPSIIKLLDNNSSLTHIISAGAFLSSDLRSNLSEAFPNAVLYNNYGQTEIGPRALSMNSRNKNFFSDSTGYPVKGIKFRIVDQMIEFKGRQIMLGYLNSDSPVDKDGWLKTGDKASECDGLITILGRADDLVQIDGKRVSLIKLKVDIANILNRKGVALIQDSDLRVLCFIESSLTRQEHSELILRLSLNIPYSNFLVISSIPYLANGKVDFAALKMNINSKF